MSEEEQITREERKEEEKKKLTLESQIIIKTSPGKKNLKSTEAELFSAGPKASRSA